MARNPELHARIAEITAELVARGKSPTTALATARRLARRGPVVPTTPVTVYTVEADGMAYGITGVGTTLQEAVRTFAEAYARRPVLDRPFLSAFSQLCYSGAKFGKWTPGVAVLEGWTEWTPDEEKELKIFDRTFERAYARELGKRF